MQLLAQNGYIKRFYRCLGELVDPGEVIKLEGIGTFRASRRSRREFAMAADSKLANRQNHGQLAVSNENQGYAAPTSLLSASTWLRT